MDNMDADYRAIPELDRYDPELLDEAEQDELDYAERQRVEAILAERDDREGRARQRGCVRVCVALRAFVLRWLSVLVVSVGELECAFHDRVRGAGNTPIIAQRAVHAVGIGCLRFLSIP